MTLHVFPELQRSCFSTLSTFCLFQKLSSFSQKRRKFHIVKYDHVLMYLSHHQHNGEQGCHVSFWTFYEWKKVFMNKKIPSSFFKDHQSIYNTRGHKFVIPTFLVKSASLIRGLKWLDQITMHVSFLDNASVLSKDVFLKTKILDLYPRFI